MTKQELVEKLDYFDKMTEDLRISHMDFEAKSGKFKEEWLEFVKNLTGQEMFHHKDMIRATIKVSENV